MQLFVGIDWGNRTHAVCVVDEKGEKKLELEVEHRGEAVLSFVQQLTTLAQGDVSRVYAAMEAPHGVMVEALLDRGMKAFSINPKQLDRFRDRFSASGAKDDALDAYVLASCLRTDQRLFREIRVPSAELLKLRALSRSHDAITEHVLALGSQIHQELVRYYPQMAELGEWHRERWLWELFEAAPTPASAAPPRPRTGERGLSLVKVGAIMKEARIRRYTPDDVLQRLRTTPLPVAHGVAEASSTRVAMMLPILRAADQQLRACSKEMAALLASLTAQSASDGESDSPEKTHHDAALLLSFPGIGVHNGAVMLTEGLTAIQQRDYQGLRRLAGVAPVSRRTGGRRQKPLVAQRHACNGRLREATYHWTRVAMQHDKRAHEHYAQLRARGHSHGRAIRGVCDRLLQVLVAVLRSGKTYDAERRSRATQPPLAA